MQLLSTVFFLISGILAISMAAGFAMFEAGLVRAHNTATTCLKVLALYAVSALAIYVIGYNIMYVNVDGHGLWGSFQLLAVKDTPANLFFTMSFAGIVAAIVSGALAERLRVGPFLIFTFLLAALILPLQGAWIWGGGWLSALGFKDFAGSTVLHSVGGWCALSGAIILGPRFGKYAANGKIRAFLGANIPLTTLGTLILWVGFLGLALGFFSESVLATNSAKAGSTLSLSLINFMLAASAGAMASMLYAKVRYGKPDITIVLNGTLAGLVSISAGANIIDPAHGCIIGALGGVLCAAAIGVFDKLKIDDVTGALSTHLLGGIWGTLAVAIFSTGDYLAQITGIVVVAAFSLSTSSLIWLALKKICGLRLAEKDESIGSDRAEIGIKAYPDFEVNSAD